MSRNVVSSVPSLFLVRATHSQRAIFHKLDAFADSAQKLIVTATDDDQMDVLPNAAQNFKLQPLIKVMIL